MQVKIRNKRVHCLIWHAIHGITHNAEIYIFNPKVFISRVYTVSGCIVFVIKYVGSTQLNHRSKWTIIDKIQTRTQRRIQGGGLRPGDKPPLDQ